MPPRRKPTPRGDNTTNNSFDTFVEPSSSDESGNDIRVNNQASTSVDNSLENRLMERMESMDRKFEQLMQRMLNNNTLVPTNAAPTNRILNMEATTTTNSSTDAVPTSINAIASPVVAPNISAPNVQATPGGTVLDSFGHVVPAAQMRSGTFISTATDAITHLKDTSVFSIRKLQREMQDQDRANNYSQQIYLYKYVTPAIRMQLVGGWLAKRTPLGIVYTDSMLQAESNEDILFALAQLGIPKSTDQYKRFYRAAIRYKPLDKWSSGGANLHDPKELQQCMDVYVAYMSHIMEIDKFVTKYWSAAVGFRPSVWKPVGQLDGTKENAYLIWIIIDVDTLSLCKLMHNKLGMTHQNLNDLALYTAAMTKGFQTMQDTAITYGPTFDMVSNVLENLQIKPKNREDAVQSTKKAFSILQRPQPQELTVVEEIKEVDDPEFDRNEVQGVNYGMGQTTTSGNLLMAPMETEKPRQSYPCGHMLRGMQCTNSRCTANHDPNVVRSSQKQIVDAFGRNKITVPNNVRPPPQFSNAKTHQPQLMNIEDEEEDTWSDSGMNDRA